MADIFGRTGARIETPITADKCEIIFDGKPVAHAIQISIDYNQGVIRRRSIGSKAAVIYGTQPSGRASIAQLITSENADGHEGNSWTTCKGGTLTFALMDCEEKAGKTYTANGCLVTSFSISASAEDLTVMENIVIEFMELTEG